MEKGFVMREGENGFERAMGILEMIYKLPDNLSEEDVEAMKNFVFPELQHTVIGLLELPADRELELFFFRLLLGVFKEAQRAQEEGKKLVFIPFTFPPEIFYAFDNIFPLCTEIVGGLITNICYGQGERFWDFAMGLGLPDSLCSANTIGTMPLFMGPGIRPDAIVYNSAGSCNPNAKIHAFASDYLGIPQFVLEKPVDESARGRELYRGYMKRFIRELEEWSGSEMREERLREVLEKSYQAVRLYHEYWELKKARPCPVPNIFSMTLLVLRSQLWGRQEAVDVLQKMVDISKERLRKGEYTAEEELARIYITYIYWLFDFSGYFTWLEKQGISILGDILAIHFFPEMDFSTKESMLEGLADIAFDYPMTRQMGGESISLRWLDDVAWAAQDLGADACVFGGVHACKHTLGTAAFFRREMMKRLGLPTLMLTGDVFDKRHTPMEIFQEEVKTFVEQVVARKRAQARRKKAGPSGDAAAESG
ncbi:MAG: 2-hydroxyacyl-CoA dehydratase family protein [Actinomycetota bacterium]|nr:2-hydroxyacyl-CoA dehydratase family protein [Actinomycetota bacterium]